jgi:acyl transferase domain-containing protein/acyl carrier protein/NADP-dependent 3-hydroxy acid dehydrogenase YdfG
MSDLESATFPPEPLAVIGISCLFPKAADVSEFWSNIRRGVDAITEIPPTHWDVDAYFDADPKTPDKTYARRGGFLSPVDFDPLEFGIAPSNLEAIDTSQLLGLVGAKRALEDAGYGAERTFDRSRVGCILGVTGTLEMVIPLGARLGHPRWRQALQEAGVADDVADDVIRRISESYVPWQENSFPGLLGNVVAGRIANRLDLGGTNCVVDAACASSLSALHLAALELWSGRSDMVVTGGVDTFNDIFMFMCFSKTPALSPTGDARPFSDAGDGTILGEGVGMFVLKRYRDAQRDGDKVYALIRGVGTSSDGAGNAVYAPKKEGQVRCLRDAYRVAGVSPDTVELIEAHGTGTKVGDATELSALADVFQSAGRTGRWCAVGSIKSQIGHTKAAAGAAGLLKAILALKHRVLPPTIKIDRPLPALLDETSPLYANPQARPWLPARGYPRRAGVSAFGFGGSNFHCVLEESPTLQPDTDWDDDVFFAAWSADSRDELAARIREWNGGALRRKAAQSRREFRPTQTHRLVIVADAITADVSSLVATALDSLTKFADRSSWSTPEGIHYASGPRPGKLGLLFPGQGSQYVGMQRELACRFPALQAVLAEANDVFAELAGPSRGRLSDYIYPIPAFDEATRWRQDEALRDTEIAQPALGAVSLGLLAVLSEFGIRPEVVAGHSYGELTALCASRRFAPAALYRLSMLRGRLMAEAQEVEGGMLAVGAPLSQVEAALKEAAVDLVIANRNSPTQVVLSGRVAELERASEVFARRNIRGKRLPVSAAFHSPLVASASRRFRPILQDVEFAAPEIPVFANTHAEEYPSDPDEARSLLAGQLAHPVEFVRQIENMYDSGVRLFLEVGPGNVLTGLVNSILAGRDHRAMAVDGSFGKRSGMLDLALVLGQLAVAGYPVKLSGWDPVQLSDSAETPSDTRRMTIPICGANYVKPRTPRPPRARKEEGVGGGDGGLRDKDEGLEVRGQRLEIRDRESEIKDDGLGVRDQGRALGTQSAGALPALRVLQQMFEQTAQLHRQFLEGQEAALQMLQSLSGQAPAALREPTPLDDRPVPAAVQHRAVPVPATPTQTDGVERPDVDNRLAELVLAVVADKTGYPAEMLKPEMSLDHDLGIDSIKRVEILSALQERRPDLPAVQPEQLGTLHRLSDVIALLGDVAPHGAAVDASHVRENRVPTENRKPSHRDFQSSDELAAIVLAVVAEKTGYPAEMLKPEMSLDHDLGIDSIKRVEILSALQERRPDLPVVQPEQLGTLHRLSDVIALLGESTVSAPSGDQRHLRSSSLSLHVSAEASSVSLFVGVPVAAPFVNPGLPLSIPAGATILVVGDGAQLSLRIAERLTHLGYRGGVASWDDPTGHPLPHDLAGLILVAPEGGISDEQLWRGLEWVQKCGPALRRNAAGQATVLATVSRLDGQFGFGTSKRLVDPLSGALTGLAKTVRREWPEVSARGIDVASTAVDVSELVDRLLCDGPVEFGWTETGWVQIEETEGVTSEESSSPIAPGELLVVTGGARGVTAAAAIAVARAWRPRLVLCGRTPYDDVEPDWLGSCRTPAEIKQAVARHVPSGTSLRDIDQQARHVLANREIRATLETIRGFGVDVDYLPLDIRDASAVRRGIADLSTKYGPIRGVIHGAGVLEDRKIEDKTREQFEHVYATKVIGLRNVLGALDGDQLRFLALFSSYTGRYGRVGQVDYAMANEALNKFAQEFQRTHPSCRVRAFNWGPWDGGMVTDSLKPLFAKEGVGLIPLDAGARLLVRELERGPTANAEVVVLAKAESSSTRREPTDAATPSAAGLADLVLAVVSEKTGYPVEMLKPQMSLDHDLGIDSIKRVEILSALQERRPDLPAVSPEQLGTLHRLTDVIGLLGSASPALGIGEPGTANGAPPASKATQSSMKRDERPAVEAPIVSLSGRCGWDRTLDVEGHRYLASHVIGGKAVLPTAMILECLAHAALHHHPGLEFVGVSGLRVFKGVRLTETERVRLRGLADKAVRSGTEFRVETRLAGNLAEGEVLHAKAAIVLSSSRPAPMAVRLPQDLTSRGVPLPTAWYDSLLFHGPRLQGLKAIESLNAMGIVVRAQTAPPPSEWLADPWRSAWLADPLAIDVALQAIIVWTQAVHGIASLPTAIGEYRQYRASFPATNVRIVIHAERRNDAAVAAEAEILDESGEMIAAMTGIEYVVDAQLTESFRSNRLAESGIRM